MKRQRILIGRGLAAGLAATLYCRWRSSRNRPEKLRSSVRYRCWRKCWAAILAVGWIMHLWASSCRARCTLG
jgi:hypothetical protein